MIIRTSQTESKYNPSHADHYFGRQGKVYERSKFQKFVFKSFLFCKILKMREKKMKYANFFVFVLYGTKRRCSQLKPQLKVEIEDGRDAL